MTRLFDAPRHLVFEAMSKPEHIKRWWGCLGDGYSVPVCEVDLRVGGKWRFVNRHPKGEAAFHGVYREIEPPGRVVFTEIFEPFPDAGVGGDRGADRRERQDAPDGGLSSTRRRKCATWCSAPAWRRAPAISYDRLEEVARELQGA